MRGENGWEITEQRSGDSDKKMEDRVAFYLRKGNFCFSWTIVWCWTKLSSNELSIVLFQPWCCGAMSQQKLVSYRRKKGTKGGMTLRRSEGETTIPDLYFRRARDQMYYEKRSRKDEEFRRMARRARAQLFPSSLSFHLIVYRSSRNRFVINGPFTFTALH